MNIQEYRDLISKSDLEIIEVNNAIDFDSDCLLESSSVPEYIKYAYSVIYNGTFNLRKDFILQLNSESVMDCTSLTNTDYLNLVKTGITFNINDDSVYKDSSGEFIQLPEVKENILVINDTLSFTEHSSNSDDNTTLDINSPNRFISIVLNDVLGSIGTSELNGYSHINKLDSFNSNDILFIDFSFISDEDLLSKDNVITINELMSEISEKYGDVNIRFIRQDLVDSVIYEEMSTKYDNVFLEDLEEYDLSPLCESISNIVKLNYDKIDYFSLVKSETDKVIRSIGYSKMNKKKFFFSTTVTDSSTVTYKVQQYIICLFLSNHVSYFKNDFVHSTLVKNAFTEIKQLLNEPYNKTMYDRLKFLRDLPRILLLINFDYTRQDVAEVTSRNIFTNIVSCPLDNIKQVTCKETSVSFISGDDVTKEDRSLFNLVDAIEPYSKYMNCSTWGNVRDSVNDLKDKLLKFKKALLMRKGGIVNKDTILDFTNTFIYSIGDKEYIAYVRKIDVNIKVKITVNGQFPMIQSSLTEDALYKSYIPYSIFYMFIYKDLKPLLDGLSSCYGHALINKYKLEGILQRKEYCNCIMDLKEKWTRSVTDGSISNDKSSLTDFFMKGFLEYIKNTECLPLDSYIDEYELFVFIFTNVMPMNYILTCRTPSRYYSYIKSLYLNRAYKTRYLKDILKLFKTETSSGVFRGLSTLFSGISPYEDLFIQSELQDNDESLEETINRLSNFNFKIILTT